MRLMLLSSILLLLTTCGRPVSPEQVEAEIRQTEAAFNQLAEERGLKAAFSHFAADEGALIRGKQLIEGKSAITAYFDRPTGMEDVRLTWAPDRIIVSEAGDMAYSFGKYQFSARDTSGQLFSDEGIFRTLWKKQSDGSWRYLVD